MLPRSLYDKIVKIVLLVGGENCVGTTDQEESMALLAIVA